MIEEKLTSIEHIRKRPAMYIGDLSSRGLKTMLGYFFDDILKNCDYKIEINIDFKTNNQIVLSIKNIDTHLFIETIEKLNVENKLVSSGLPLLIALSEKVSLKITNNSSLISLTSTKGKFKFDKKHITNKTDILEIEFKIDQIIFKETELNYEAFNQFLRKYVFINTNCRIISHDSRTEIRQTNLIDYPNGLSQQLNFKISEQLYGKSFFRLDLTTETDNYKFQICISYQDIWLSQTIIQTYANYDELILGGSLEQGILEGLFNAIKKIGDKKQINIDRRKLKEQLILLSVIKGENFVFEGSTKTKIWMPKVRKYLKEFVAQQTEKYLAENVDIKEQILEKFKKYE